MKAKIFSRVIGITSLLATSHAYAMVSVNNCKITQNDSRVWEASFDFSSTYDADISLNAIYIGIVTPDKNNQIGGQTTQTVTPTPLTPADVTITSNITGLVANNAIRYVTGDSLRISQNSAPGLIYTGSGTVKVRLNLDLPTLYPALKINALEQRKSAPGYMTYEQWAYAIPGRTTGCLNGTGASVTVPPKEDLIDTDPKFTLKTAQWMLGAADVGDLPDVSVPGNGYAATINNLASNNLCVNYLTSKVQNKSYALSVSNGYSSQGGRNLFAMNGSNGSQLLYNLQLMSNDGVTGNNFNFPATAANYITLSQLPSSVDKRSEMCWTPKINLFKNATTQAGMHTDTLNIMVTPKA